MKLPHLQQSLQFLLVLFVLSLFPKEVEAQTSALLDFSQNVQATTGTNPNGFALGPYYNGSVIDYTNVATLGGVAIDARMTATAFGTGYSFVGHLPNYSQNSPGQPAGDTGVVYNAATPGNAGGIVYKMDFYTHSSNFTTRFVIPQARILVYDVDGEATQSEAVRAFKSDGLLSYQIGTDPTTSLIVTDNQTNALFQGRNTNVSETSALGDVIFLYQNTSTITLQFEANTLSRSPANNGVFSGIDGDLSILNGNESGFGAPVVVPEPSSALLAVLPLVAGLLGRRKRTLT